MTHMAPRGPVALIGLLLLAAATVHALLLPIDQPAAIHSAEHIASPSDSVSASSATGNDVEIDITTVHPKLKETKPQQEPGAEFRLPQTMHPEHYKLEVITHLNDSDNDGFRFSGRVWIKIVCDHATDRITLHSRQLNINESALSVHELHIDDAPSAAGGIPNNLTETLGIAQPTVGIRYDDKRDFMHIDLAQQLRPGHKYELFIAFEAPLAKGLSGYYMSSYFDKAANKDVYLAVTQFEPTYARLAFPCFDEPAFKAKFEIVLGRNNKYKALSNMPLVKSEPFKNRANWTWDFFAESVPMSTYLVAYSINDFEYRESIAHLKSFNVTFRIWARRDAINQVEYARTLGPQVLAFYEKYFDVEFPLPKMDMMAVPDFSAGAMENWGLVTYRETLLLYSPETSSSSNKHNVASVIAHELAHQWFGNLVTMRWWDDLWLNEGFATYVASLGVERLHPEWNSFVEESLSNTLSIFSFDSLRSSHPVKVQIEDPATITQIFDSISYKKGSTILRMMHRFLGEKSFQRGVHNYLVKHAFGNAVQDNLWHSLTEEAHRQGTLPKTITVKQIMDKWTLQTGYPKVTVLRDYDTGEAQLQQRRYLVRTAAPRKPADEQCWWVPLSYTTSGEGNFNDTAAKDWMECEKHPKATTEGVLAPVKTLSGLPGRDEWVLFNIDMSGLYKVQYDRHNWQLLIDQLNGPQFKDIAMVNRAQLIDDAMELAWTGDLNYTIALPLLRYLGREEEYVPWVAALANLDRVSRQLKRTPKFGQFRVYMRQILGPIYSKLGGLNAGRVTGDAEDVVKQKVQIGAMACRYEVGDCVEKSQQYFRQWMLMDHPDQQNHIPIDLRKIVYCTAMRHGGDVEWSFLWQRYQATHVASVRDLILRSLGCSREVWLLSRYLEVSLNETYGIRTQDASSVFASVAHGEVGFFVAQTFFEQNIDAIYKQHKSEASRLSRYVNALASQMKTDEEAEHLREFIGERAEVFAKSSKGIEQALETIEVNRLWHDFNYDDIGRYLRNNPADGSTVPVHVPVALE